MKTLLLLVVFLPLCCFSQHVITTKSGQKMDCKITQISDSTLSYQLPSKAKTKNPDLRTYSIAKEKVASYCLQDGIEYQVSMPKVIVQKDTIVSIVKTEENVEMLQQYMQNQNKAISEALKTTGTVSLSVGVPCLAGGIAALLYSNLLPNPISGYTTSKSQAQKDGSTYITMDEYNTKVKDFNRKTHYAEVAGYVMTPLGGALTIVGIPLYVKGNKMLQLKVQYTGNGAGVAVSF